MNIDKVDAGLVFNREQGRALFAPGQVTQIHISEGVLELWIEIDRAPYGTFYHLGTGPQPEYGEALTREELIVELLKLGITPMTNVISVLEPLPQPTEIPLRALVPVKRTGTP